MQETHRYLQQHCKIPMFISANLEAGGDGIATNGASFEKQMQIAAATLVKDTQQLLPISPYKHKRVLLEILGDFSSNERVSAKVKELLTKEGFEVIPYTPEDFTRTIDNVSDIKSKYDLVLYIANIENASNKTVSRINWYTFFGLGNNLPWFVEEVPE